MICPFRSKKTLEEEKQKFKDMLAHFERERQLESDTGTLRLVNNFEVEHYEEEIGIIVELFSYFKFF